MLGCWTRFLPWVPVDYRFWIISQGACESHDVWLEVRTGRVKLLHLADA